MLHLSDHVAISLSEIELNAIRAQGAGGQNINKVSTAIHLRFDIHASSLPPEYKAQLLARKDKRITHDGIIIIKAQRYRNQEKNKTDALSRLHILIKNALVSQKERVATRPSKGAKRRRIEKKTNRSQIKSLRKKITAHEN